MSALLAPPPESMAASTRALVVVRTTGDPIADRRFAWAQGCREAGDHAAAAEMAEHTLALAPRFAPAWALLGEARLALGDEAGACDALSRALALEPEDVLGVSIALARLGALDQADAMTPAYVRALFDGYAEAFETHLTERLRYRGPSLVAALLERLAPGRRFGAVLDLGCGTGLMGEAIRARAERLEGIDLAPAMVEKAREKGVYDTLAVAELTDRLAACPPASFDLILAADVMVYIGDPIHVLTNVAAALVPGGLFAFTVQAHPGAGFAIGADARFAHSAAFLRERAEQAGLVVAAVEEAWSRCDAGRPVEGHVVALRRPAEIAALDFSHRD